MRQITSNTSPTPRPFAVSLVTGVLLASALLASSLSAQDRSSRPTRQGRPPVGDSLDVRRPMPRQPMAGMPRADAGLPRAMAMPRGGRGSAATAILRQRERLGLSEDQVRRLERLADAPSPARNDTEMLRARADLMDAMRGDGNVAAARAAMERLNRIRTEQALASLRARQEARDVLTETQRRRLEEGRVAVGAEPRGRARQRMQAGARRRAIEGAASRGLRPGMAGPGVMRPAPVRPLRMTPLRMTPLRMTPLRMQPPRMQPSRPRRDAGRAYRPEMDRRFEERSARGFTRHVEPRFEPRFERRARIRPAPMPPMPPAPPMRRQY